MEVFITIIEKLYSISSFITSGNEVVALLILSVLVKMILKPLEILITNLSKTSLKRKQRIKKLVDEIDEAYKGQTRMYYLKTLYRQNGISPIVDYIPLLSTLIQIPFFIAAYKFIESSSLFQNVEWWVISNIGLADKLLPFKGVEINVLPFVMTGISLMSAYVYSLGDKEKLKPLTYIALIFLVILYNMPAALLIYWTCSNLLSLIENIYRSEKKLTLKLPAIKYQNMLAYLRIAVGSTLTYVFLFLLLSPFPESLSYSGAFWVLGILVVPYIYITLKKNEEVRPDKDKFLIGLVIIPILHYANSNIVFLTNGLYKEYFIKLFLIPIIVLCIIRLLMKKLRFRLIFTSIAFGCLAFTIMPLWTEILKTQIETGIGYQVILVLLLSLVSYYLLSKYKEQFRIAVVIMSIILCGQLTYRSVRITLKNSEANKKTQIPEVIAKANVVKKHSVFILVYDAYVGPSVMRTYGIDNQKHYEFLKESGFTNYGDKLSFGKSSLSSISKMLAMKEKTSIAKRKYMVGHGVFDKYLATHGYKRTYYASEFFFKGQGNYALSEIVIPGRNTKQTNMLLMGVLQGEFKFDTGFASGGKWLATKREVLERSDSSRFVYSHSPYPGHSQNSGTCLKDETQRYEHKLSIANNEMKEDIKQIEKNYPDSIIIIAGDHGAYLGGDCRGYIKKESISQAEFVDMHSAFVSIKWPENRNGEHHNFKTLQGVTNAVLTYLTNNAKIMSLESKSDICYKDLCVKTDGKVTKGPHKGKSIFGNLGLLNSENLSDSKF